MKERANGYREEKIQRECDGKKVSSKEECVLNIQVDKNMKVFQFAVHVLVIASAGYKEQGQASGRKRKRKQLAARARKFVFFMGCK